MGPARRRTAPSSGDTGRAKAGYAAADVGSAAADVGSAAARLGTRIGVISDNHGYLDPAVLQIFAGVSHIIHAGDMMDPEILERLRAVAPVTAVAGNMDTGDLASFLPPLTRRDAADRGVARRMKNENAKEE